MDSSGISALEICTVLMESCAVTAGENRQVTDPNAASSAVPWTPLGGGLYTICARSAYLLHPPGLWCL
jgi:hypothetical protein